MKKCNSRTIMFHTISDQFFNWNFLYTSIPKGNWAFIPPETIFYHFKTAGESDFLK